MKIAYITYDGVMKYTSANNFNEIEDLLPFLQHKGLDITAEVWNDPRVDWTKYDVALLKTPWDYHHKFDEFKLWLEKIGSLHIKLLNDYQIVRWNMDKHYLKEVAEAGFDVIPSVFLDRGWTGDLDPLFKELNSDKLIIKPCVSGGSKDTLVLHRSAAIQDQDNVLELIAERDFIVQPFVNQIGEGEWSFIFFNGRYSHTIIKKPKAGDFRVQQIFGGTIEMVSPEQKYIDRAATYISRFAQHTLYARVDGVMVNEEFILMELELVEPFLYLSYHPDAVGHYYNALKEQLAAMH